MRKYKQGDCNFFITLDPVNNAKAKVKVAAQSGHSWFLRNDVIYSRNGIYKIGPRRIEHLSLDAGLVLGNFLRAS